MIRPTVSTYIISWQVRHSMAVVAHRRKSQTSRLSPSRANQILLDTTSSSQHTFGNLQQPIPSTKSLHQRHPTSNKTTIMASSRFENLTFSDVLSGKRIFYSVNFKIKALAFCSAHQISAHRLPTTVAELRDFFLAVGWGAALNDSALAGPLATKLLDFVRNNVNNKALRPAMVETADQPGLSGSNWSARWAGYTTRWIDEEYGFVVNHSSTELPDDAEEDDALPRPAVNRPYVSRSALLSEFEEFVDGVEYGNEDFIVSDEEEEEEEELEEGEEMDADIDEAAEQAATQARTREASQKAAQAEINRLAREKAEMAAQEDAARRDREKAQKAALAQQQAEDRARQADADVEVLKGHLANLMAAFQAQQAAAPIAVHPVKISDPIISQPVKPSKATASTPKPVKNSKATTSTPKPVKNPKATIQPALPTPNSQGRSTKATANADIQNILNKYASTTAATTPGKTPTTKAKTTTSTTKAKTTTPKTTKSSPTTKVPKHVQNAYFAGKPKDIQSILSQYKPAAVGGEA